MQIAAEDIQRDNYRVSGIYKIKMKMMWASI